MHSRSKFAYEVERNWREGGRPKLREVARFLRQSTKLLVSFEM